VSAHNIAVVYRKELTEALRDRRTLISTIVVPLLLFPVMIVGFASVASMLVDKAKEESPKVMILGGGDSPAVIAELKKVEKVEIIPSAANWKDQVINKEVLAVVDIPQGFQSELTQQKEETVKIYIYGG
jgi:sodium transport system permease protein